MGALPADPLSLLAALLAAIGALALVCAIFYPRLVGLPARERRFRAIALDGTAPGAVAEVREERRRKKSVEDVLRDLDDKQKARKRSRDTLEARLAQAGLAWTPATFATVSVGVGVVVSLVALVALPLVPLAAIVLGATAGALLPRLYVSRKRNRRFAAFTAELPVALDVIVRGVRSGLPLGDCLRIIASEAREPVRGEFQILVGDQAVGITLEEAVKRLADRVPIPEANFFAIVVSIQSRTGGSLSEALGNLSRVLRERKKMEGKIKAMSAESKASGMIIGALPFLVAVIVYLTTPEYIALLVETGTGRIVLGVCAVWMSIGIFVMSKMINFKF